MATATPLIKRGNKDVSSQKKDFYRDPKVLATLGALTVFVLMVLSIVGGGALLITNATNKASTPASKTELKQPVAPVAKKPAVQKNDQRPSLWKNKESFFQPSMEPAARPTNLGQSPREHQSAFTEEYQRKNREFWEKDRRDKQKANELVRRGWTDEQKKIHAIMQKHWQGKKR